MTPPPAAAWGLCIWHHEYRRRIALEYEYGYRRSPSSPPPKGGFTDQVEHSFDHYFSTYAPEPENRTAWLQETAGVRRALRDEITRIYRETEVKAGHVRWLIRFMVRDVRRRWLEGLALEPQEIHRMPFMSKVRYVGLFLLLGPATMTVLSAAFQQAPVVTVGCVLLAAITARFTIPLWLNIHSERRRFHEQTQEREEIVKERQAEYQRWKGKLDELRPEEQKMEGWLDADKTLILNQALKHHRLGWHEVIAHAFLPTSNQPCKSAHVRRGPWRYSRYKIRVFLVTEEGVREAIADLDFEHGTWEERERYNYRFDALSSVHVEIKSLRGYTLNITLNNGPTKGIPVTDAPTHDAPDEAPKDGTLDINLDAAGFSHTLRILSKASPPKANRGSNARWIRYPLPFPSTPRPMFPQMRVPPQRHGTARPDAGGHFNRFRIK